MTIKGSLLIHGGTVVDPARNFFSKSDVLIKDNKIINMPLGEKIVADTVIHADDCLVLPGLIDYHTHVFPNGTGIGIYPDSAHLPQGVTTVVDQGSSGVNNFESFLSTSINNSQIRIFAYLHASPAGLALLPQRLEPADPKLFDIESIHRLFEKHDKELVGLKIRKTKEIVGELGLAPLKATVEMANILGCRVVVHTTNSPGEVEDLVSLLRPGDVFTHMYHGKGSTMIDKDGKVKKAIREARTRGVLFDTADGRGHYAFSVAKAAIAEDFLPDIISTDLVKASMFKNTVFGLPLMMTKYLNLGLSLPKIVQACTSIPAGLLGMKGKLGTLAPGAYADVAVFQLKKFGLRIEDTFGELLNCNQVFVPKMTVLKVNIVYRSMDFSF